MCAEEESGSAATAFLALGSNQGRRWAHLQAALAGLDEKAGVEVVEASPVYETEAHTLDPNDRQPPFLNAVIRVETTRSPKEVLQFAHEVERAEGRRRADQRWAPRPLDVDLLAYEEEMRNGNDLTLPHPRLAERRFVLRPWADLAPNFEVPPPFEQSVQELLDRCPDTAAIRRTDHVLDVSASAPPRS